MFGIREIFENTPVSDVRTESGIFRVGDFTSKILWSVGTTPETNIIYICIKVRSISYVSIVSPFALSLLQMTKHVGVGRTNGRCRMYACKYFGRVHPTPINLSVFFRRHGVKSNPFLFSHTLSSIFYIHVNLLPIGLLFLLWEHIFGVGISEVYVRHQNNKIVRFQWFWILFPLL